MDSLKEDNKDISHKDFSVYSLSSKLFTALLKKNNSNITSKITEYEIELILNKLNLPNDTSKWNKDDLEDFVEELRYTISEKEKKIKKIEVMQEEISDDIINLPEFKELKEDVQYYISIDSKDRNRQLWKNCNHFSIKFAPITQNSFNQPMKVYGAIDRTYQNVSTLELLSITIPLYTIDGDKIGDYPYLLLEIEEVYGIYEGTNKHISRAFCKMTFDKVSGQFTRFIPSKYTPIIKVFKSKISINNLTFKIKKPNGELFKFGSTIGKCEDVAKTVKNKKILSEIVPDGSLFHEPGIDSQNSYNYLESNISIDLRITCIERIYKTEHLSGKDG